MSKDSKVNAMLQAVVASFVSTEVTSAILQAGTHIAQAVKVRISHSFAKADGSPKDGPFEWKTPTPLIAITFADATGAVIMERYHLQGYVRYEDLTPKQKESGKYTASEKEGYALKDGDRIVCEKKTADCINILSGVFSALGLAPGSTLDDLQAVVDARDAEVEIVVQKCNDGKSLEVAKVRPIRESVDVTEEFK